jgi:hypothetical protein
MARHGLWPTPTASEATRGRSTMTGGRAPGRTTSLTGQVNQMWPTPAARDYRPPNAKSFEERGGGKKGEQLPNSVGGPLNPTWVEWLMGWPLGWTAAAAPTESAASGTARFPGWLLQHGFCWPRT